MEAEKLNNGNRKSGSCEAGFFLSQDWWDSLQNQGINE